MKLDFSIKVAFLDASSIHRNDKIKETAGGDKQLRLINVDNILRSEMVGSGTGAVNKLLLRELELILLGGPPSKSCTFDVASERKRRKLTVLAGVWHVNF